MRPPERIRCLAVRRKIRTEVLMLRGIMRGTIVALLLTACTTAMHFRVIDKGAYGAEASKPSVTVTKGRNESVIRLELGSRPAGGWGGEPLGVRGDPSLAPGGGQVGP